jgi:hypothetical protein
MLGKAIARVGIVALTSSVALTAVAPAAWAPKYIFNSSAYGRCGTDPGSHFEGEASIVGFAAQDGVLYADATVQGRCLDGTRVTATVPLATYRFRVNAVETDCTDTDVLVYVRPGVSTVQAFLGETKDGQLMAMSLDLGTGTTIERTWTDGDPMGDRARLCAVHRIVGHSPSATVLARLLDALVLR